MSKSTPAPVLFEARIAATDGSYVVHNGDLIFFNNNGEIIYQAGINSPFSTSTPINNKIRFLDSNEDEVWPLITNK